MESFRGIFARSINYATIKTFVKVVYQSNILDIRVLKKWMKEHLYKNGSV